MTDETPLFFEHVPGLFAVTLLQIGRRTGLLDAVLADGGTAQEVGDRAGADRRNAAEWLRGMTAAGYLTHSDGHFDATDMTSMTFGPQFPVSVTSILDGLWGAPQVYDDVIAAIRTGEGIPGERLAPYAPFVGVDTPTYEMALVEDWIWGLLHMMWKDKEVESARVLAASLILIGLGVLGTFPIFFQAFAPAE